MKTFDGISFHGTFRPYQQHVLDNVEDMLDDNKIHIVAAPGSGKTVLGLELIRRLSSPALVLSPTVTIRQQWGDRFRDNFTGRGMQACDYISFDLRSPSLITSATYQGLHAAMTKSSDREESEYAEADASVTDYAGFDLIAAVNAAGIKTVCLDEAHHLRSEWQKSLESFLQALGSDIKIIALTATPPYDSPAAEWARYCALCGEIDEEIFVPELVAQGTLCPHQDYVYFNYPTSDEKQLFVDYRNRAYETLDAIGQSEVFKQIVSDLENRRYELEETFFEYPKEFIDLFSFSAYAGREPDKKLVKLLTLTGRLPKFNLDIGETALQFIVDNGGIFVQERSEAIKKILLENGLIDKKKVRLSGNDRLDRMLVSSKGKLKSIEAIAEAERHSLGDGLRMLILTDYIKKDTLKYVGSDREFDSVSIISVFETLRRSTANAKLAVLSGQLVILPDSSLEALAVLSGENKNYTVSALGVTGYSSVGFGVSNKDKVVAVTKLFEAGFINILVGTKSLLGEGWDSPCINSLILASFVGSFVLSNQMRGRAIRVDKKDPDKVSNIWHLTTIEPPTLFARKLKEKIAAHKLEEDKTVIYSADYRMLERRFECFLGLNYRGDMIESGIDRLSEVVRPPYSENNFTEIDRKMLDMAADRASLRENWQKCVAENRNLTVEETLTMPKNAARMPRSFLFINMFFILLSMSADSMIIAAFARMPFSADNFFMFILLIIAAAFFILVFIFAFRRLLAFASPKRTLCTLSGVILETLRAAGEVRTNAEPKVENPDKLGLFFDISLTRGTVREQNVFAGAVGEMFSEIQNPRYVIIKTGLFKKSYRYAHSFACPSVIGTKKERVELLRKKLESVGGRYAAVYTRSESGRKLLIRCRKASFMNGNADLLRRKKKVKANYR